MDDTEYFPDYVETQIRGYDGDGHSVVINAATEELAGVMSAEDKIRLRSLGERIEEVNYAVTEAITRETSRAEKEEQGLGQRIDDLGDKVTTSRVNITDSSGRQMFHFNTTSNGTMQFVSDEGDGFMFKDGTEREVLLSELLDHMAALERESISLRTDVEYLKENSGVIGGGGSHSVEGEMLIVSNGGGISKISQLENDKGYLTGRIKADKIIFIDD